MKQNLYRQPLGVITPKQLRSYSDTIREHKGNFNVYFSGEFAYRTAWIILLKPKQEIEINRWRRKKK